MKHDVGLGSHAHRIDGKGGAGGGLDAGVAGVRTHAHGISMAQRTQPPPGQFVVWRGALPRPLQGGTAAASQ